MDLKTFFNINKKTAVCFSGGVDSAYLLYEAVKCGAYAAAYFVKSCFQPDFELEDAKKIADMLKVPLKIIEVDILSADENGLSRIADNPSERCYYCKRKIFETILREAEKDGLTTIIEGTNASDCIADRPGFRALTELGVKSPLREAGLTKTEIRRLSKEAGLPTFDKPAYACLATRIPAGEMITIEKLNKTEDAEKFLMSLGFRDFRVRMHENKAKLEIAASEMGHFLNRRAEITEKLLGMYDSVDPDVTLR